MSAEKELLDAADPGELGGTYAGSPLGCVAALAVLDIIETEQLNQRSEHIGQVIEDKANHWRTKYPFIGEVRRLGAMAAIEIVEDQTTRTPDKKTAAAIASYGNEHGLLLLTAGINGNIIRFLTPLVITDELLQEGLGIIEDAFKAR